MDDLYFNKEGQPITQEEWIKQFEDKRIAETTLPDGVWISTVWLGLDHGFGFGREEGRPPLIFETMIFDGPLDGEMWRYSTKEQAQEGHDRAVRLAWLYFLFPTIMGWLR